MLMFMFSMPSSPSYSVDDVLSTLNAIAKQVETQWPIVLRANVLNGRVTVDEAVDEIHEHGFATKHEATIMDEVFD